MEATHTVPGSKEIGVTELVLRDGHQSLMATRMATEDMVDACADIDAAGYWSVECWGGATYDACIRFLNEDPWERLRTFRELMPNSKLQMLLRGQNLLGYRHYEDGVVERFVEKSAECGMDVYRIFDALNDVRNVKTAIKAVRDVDKHAQGTISYTESPLHTVDGYVELAEQLMELGCDSLCIKDMAALLRPQPAYDIVRGIKDRLGEDTPVHIHCHATTGVTLVSLMKAVEAGADVVDTSISSISLGPGHNPTEAFVAMLDGTPFHTTLDADRLRNIKEHFEDIRPRYTSFMSSITGVDTDIFASQIPGGMISNMESQLRQQGAGDKLKEVLAEVPRVRKDAGYPPLVTPSSQIVGTQAVFNVLMGKYKVLTAEFADLMLGYYGETLGDRDQDIIEQAKEQTKKEPITCRPADLLEPEWDDLVASTKGLEGNNGSDQDVLTNAMFPGVAPGFFASRDEGPRNVGKDPAEVAAEKLSGESQTSGSVRGPITYKVSLGGRTQTVSVEPA